MAASVSKFVPPAAQAAPEAQVREQGLRTLQRELEATADDGLSAMLHFEIARLHEHRDDLASAAKELLAATKKAPDSVEAIEALIDISTRSRSRANLQKLLERLLKLSDGPDEILRAHLGLALVHVASEDFILARDVLLEALDETPSESALWLALEGVAGILGERPLLLRAATGRAAHARSPELRCLLLERVARLHMEAGNAEEAYSSLIQSLDEAPSFRAVHAWEQLALQEDDDVQAGLAAARSTELLERAADDPDFAAVFGAPAEERTEKRLLATRLRRVIYAVRRGELDEARSLASAVAEASPKSPLAQAILVELRRKGAESEPLLTALSQLESSGEPGSDDRIFLLGVAALTHERAGADEEASRLFRQMAELRPELNLPRVDAWLRAERSTDSTVLPQFIRALAQENREGEDFSLAAAVVSLLLDEPQRALSTLEERLDPSVLDPSVLDLVTTSLVQLAAFQKGAPERCHSTTEILAKELQSEGDSLALKWELLRQELTQGLLPASTEDLDPWARFVVALLRNGGATGDPREEIASARADLLEGIEDEERRDTLHRTLLHLNLAQDGDQRQVERLWEESKADPLLSAAAIAHLEATHAAKLNAVRDQAADASKDPTLKANWFLQSAYSYLAEGKDELSLHALEKSGKAVAGTRERLNPWFAQRELRGVPKPTLDLLETNDALKAERHLDYIVLKNHLAPDGEAKQLLSSAQPNGTRAESLFRVLLTAISSPESLPDLLETIDGFTPGQRAALALAGLDQRAAAEQLESIRALRQLRPTRSRWIAEWVLAERAGDCRAVSEAIMGLGAVLGSDSLLASVSPDDLSLSGRSAHLEYLKKRFKDLNASEEELELQQSLAWAMSEASPDELSTEHVEELLLFTKFVDPSLVDPDAQAAQLLAGYEALALLRYQEALEIFVPLRHVLPEDLTLAQGICLAAQRTDRPDLEANVTTDLARHASDNNASAELWERAGILYQDALDHPEKAEECFASAQSRSPGRPLSFERLYRFARSRNDRGRQVELIDARLLTAETDELRVELHWEKARFCRMLGRRTVALSALESLLEIDPDNLPALALTAELHLVDSRLEAAAEALRRVAQHRTTPAAERASAGLHACDLFEKLGRPRDAVELLQDLEGVGFEGNAGLERSARSLARAEDWGEAYKAFSSLNDQQDDIAARLESSRMMLAIQRDHLKDTEQLKVAARYVLRDDPGDDDAVDIVIQHDFPQEERRRLLETARKKSRQILQETPLNPPEIARFASLTEDCGDDGLERVSLGNLCLTGQLSDERDSRLRELFTRCPVSPSENWNDDDLANIVSPGQLGKAGEYARLLASHIAFAMDPTLDALGVRASMEVSPNGDSPLFKEIRRWTSAFGGGEFSLYLGGEDPAALRLLFLEQPVFVVGALVVSPLSSVARARLAAQLSTLTFGTAALLNYSPEIITDWTMAAESLAGRELSTAPEILEMTRALSKSLSKDERERLTELSRELLRAGIEIRRVSRIIATSAARAATLVHGDASILRDLPELLPEDTNERAELVAEVIQFTLSDAFFALRKKAGLEGA